MFLGWLEPEHENSLVQCPNYIERAPRVDLNRAAFLIDSQGNEHPATLMNVSGGGFAVKTEQPLFAGERIRLRADRHEALLAQICWTRSCKAGGILVEPVNLI